MAQTTTITTTTFAIAWLLRLVAMPLSLRTKDNGGAEARGQSGQCGQEQRSGPIRIIIIVVIVLLAAAAAAAGRVVVVERHAQSTESSLDVPLTCKKILQPETNLKN
jgi:predicted secreted protein